MFYDVLMEKRAESEAEYAAAREHNYRLHLAIQKKAKQKMRALDNYMARERRQEEMKRDSRIPIMLGSLGGLTSGAVLANKLNRDPVLGSAVGTLVGGGLGTAYGLHTLRRGGYAKPGDREIGMR